jgi:hypothetical protein
VQRNACFSTSIQSSWHESSNPRVATHRGCRYRVTRNYPSLTAGVACVKVCWFVAEGGGKAGIYSNFWANRRIRAGFDVERQEPKGLTTRKFSGTSEVIQRLCQ